MMLWFLPVLMDNIHISFNIQFNIFWNQFYAALNDHIKMWGNLKVLIFLFSLLHSNSSNDLSSLGDLYFWLVNISTSLLVLSSDSSNLLPGHTKHPLYQSKYSLQSCCGNTSLHINSPIEHCVLEPGIFTYTLWAASPGPPKNFHYQTFCHSNSMYLWQMITICIIPYWKK